MTNYLRQLDRYLDNARQIAAKRRARSVPRPVPKPGHDRALIFAAAVSGFRQRLPISLLLEARNGLCLDFGDDYEKAKMNAMLSILRPMTICHPNR